MTYYIAETMNGGAVNLGELWEKTKAQSLEGASAQQSADKFFAARGYLSDRKTNLQI